MNKLLRPIYWFFALEAASGVLLLVAVSLALAWANSPWAASYDALWHVSLHKPLHFWVNEALMTLFFFVVGLEIRRELVGGELASLRAAALPVAAAIGGVTLPALWFIVLNHGRAGAGGWAIPMATDIAFALGVLALVGSRVPHAARVLLLGLAVIDDIIAIIVIAVWFAAGVDLTGVAIAAVGLLLALGLRRLGARRIWLYVGAGIVMWIGLYLAGVHPTLAGVALGLVVPGAPERAIHALHPWVSFGVMPAFAFANAGVALGGAALDGDAAWLFLGIAGGLVIGKPVGIALAAQLAARLGATRSSELSPRPLVLVGTVGGIGFTMSLFIAQLAFVDASLLATAKLAILAGSAVAMLAGVGYGLVALRR